MYIRKDYRIGSPA